MIRTIILTALFAFVVCSCKGQGNNAGAITDATPMRVHRFDSAVYTLITSGDTTLRTRLLETYPEMTEILGKGVFNMQSPHHSGFFTKMEGYYSEPTLRQLYADALAKYSNIEEIEQSLGNVFAWMHEQFPSMQIPAVYMHVSGLSQNILVGDSLLSLSIDKYMGEDYPLYRDFFYEYQRRKMTPQMVVPDYVSGWLMSEYPFAGRDNVLLDCMVYAGKIRYAVLAALPDIPTATLLGYTDEDMKWCEDNEAEIWKAIIERKHLLTPDRMTTERYFDDAPAAFLSDSAPAGNIGVWIGLQIVRRYMSESGASLEALMQNEDAQDILNLSKYKP